MMVEVVGVRFKKVGRIYYFHPGEHQLQVGEKVVVETSQGLECGEVVIQPKAIPDEDISEPLKPVLRKASENDMEHLHKNRLQERDAILAAVGLIQKHEHKMKLLNVDFTLDGIKAIFYFASVGRIDFRDLVKDLAATLRTRIELRQIGLRDEAKLLGGIGPCGRPTCCSTFLADFEPVSIRMAKEQGLSLNPTKISGLCGKLMCCLKYENDQYKEIKEELPAVGTIVQTKSGMGTIVDIHPIKESVTVALRDSERILVSGKDLVIDPAANRAKQERHKESLEPRRRSASLEESSASSDPDEPGHSPSTDSKRNTAGRHTRDGGQPHTGVDARKIADPKPRSGRGPDHRQPKKETPAPRREEKPPTGERRDGEEQHRPQPNRDRSSRSQ